MHGGMWDQRGHVGWKGSCVGVCRARRTWRARHNQCMVVFGISGTMEGWKGSCMTLSRARRTWKAQQSQCMVVFGIRGTMKGGRGHAWGSVGPEGYGGLSKVHVWGAVGSEGPCRVEGVMRGGL